MAMTFASPLHPQASGRRNRHPSIVGRLDRCDTATSQSDLGASIRLGPLAGCGVGANGIMAAAPLPDPPPVCLPSVLTALPLSLLWLESVSHLPSCLTQHVPVSVGVLVLALSDLSPSFRPPYARSAWTRLLQTFSITTV